MVRRLLYLSGLAILTVILFHAAGLGFVAMFPWREQYVAAAGGTVASPVGTPSYWLLRFLEQIAVFAIPAFMFVSGFFVAFATGRAQRTLGWDAVFARIKSLLIPYTLWTLILFAYGFLQGQRPGLVGYATMYLTGRTSPAYYYVPLLIQLYLLAPFLIPVARKRPALLLIATGLIQCIVQLSYQPAFLNPQDPTLAAMGTFIPKWLFVTRLFAFSAGIVAGFHLAALKRFLARAKWGLVAVAILLIPLGMLEWEIYFQRWAPEWLSHRETFIDSFYSAAVILAILAFSDAALPFARPLENLGSRTFGIYLIHLPVMELFARVVYHVAPILLGYQIILLPLLTAVGLAVPLGLMWLVNHSPARRYYRYIFG